MRYSIIILCLTFSFCAHSQDDIISRTQDLVNVGGNFYITDSTAIENGTNTPDIDFTRRLLGDTAATARYLKSQAVKYQKELSGNIAESFGRGRVNTDFARLRTIYNSITGGEIFAAIAADYIDTYRGRYRVDDLVEDTQFFATVDTTGAGATLRIVSEADGSQWTILPLSEKNFRIQGWNGGNYDMYWNGVSRKDGALIYNHVLKVDGSDVLRIIKIENR